MTGTLEKRFWEKVDKRNALDCWEWTAGKGRGGYGLIKDEAGRLIRAHRFSFELVNGPIQAGMHVLHHCDNPSCCNPAHLFLGTNSDNVADRESKGRGNWGHLSNAFGEKNRNAKLTDSNVLEIRSRMNQSQRQIASEFGISKALVGYIRNRLRWTHLPQIQGAVSCV